MMDIPESEALTWAELLRTEANSLRLSINALQRMADRLDPPPSMPEPNRSSHQS